MEVHPRPSAKGMPQRRFRMGAPTKTRVHHQPIQRNLGKQRQRQQLTKSERKEIATRRHKYFDFDAIKQNRKIHN